MTALRNLRWLAVAAMLGVGSFVGIARSADDTPKPALTSEAAITTRQIQVGEKFGELKAVLIRMAELTAATDPRRAALLKKAVVQANERGIDGQFDALVDLLKQEQLSKAVKGQGEVKQDLDSLLELLLTEDNDRRVQSQKDLIRGYIKIVNQLIKTQKVIQAETGGEADPNKLADEEGKLSDKTGELARKIEKNEGKGSKPTGESTEGNGQEPKKEGSDGDAEKGDKGKKGEAEKGEKPSGDKPKEPTEKPSGDKPAGEKPSQEGEGKAEGKGEGKGQGQGQGQGKGDGEAQDGGQQQAKAPDNPVQQRLEQAQERMKEAQRKLEEAKRSDAKDKQEEAIRELEQAKAELEEILRQLREEEIARMLAALEQRFRKMLQMQIAVYEGTKRLDRIQEKDRDRDDEIESGRLSRKESEIVGEADRAMALLAEDGTAVAFPEAVQEMREDMEQVVVRLAQFKWNLVTQGIEEDIIAALEEMIEALKKAQKELRDRRPPPPGGGGQPQEDPLVDQISELKMIRALQMRVNRRTQRYGELIQAEETDKPELLKALNHLAEREERIYRVTRDIVAGRNK